MATDNVAKMTPEQLRDELAATKRVAQVWFRKATGCKRELAQARAEYADVKIGADIWFDRLIQARAELKDLQGANRSLVRQLAGMEAFRDFWRREHGRDVKRLATLDAAKAALADCGSRGIYTDFDDPADAIMQMAARIEKLEDGPMIKVEIAGQEMVEALQAEHQLRQEAEKCHKAALTLAASREARLDAAEHRAEDLEQEWDDVHQALNECQVPRDYPDGTGASRRTRIFWLNQRAERAEALAQLVTPELATLLNGLVALAEGTDVHVPALLRSPMLRTIDEARELATRIKEALSDSQA